MKPHRSLEGTIKSKAYSDNGSDKALEDDADFFKIHAKNLTFEINITE